MRFPYKQTNGILRHLYDHYRKDYEKLIISDAVNKHDRLVDIFDFNSSTYWTSEFYQQKIGEWFSFCLTNCLVNITDYEITTSNFGNRPTKWNFSISSDGSNYYNHRTEQHNMAQNEVYRVPYLSPSPVKCFKFESIGNTTQNEYRVDIVQIEIYGFITNIKDCFTCHQRTFSWRNALISCFLFLIV